MSLLALQEAVVFATERHLGQWREGEPALPYICHPLEVLGILRYLGGVEDEDMLIAAVLHDLVEETNTTVDEVRTRFGSAVATLVEELTRIEPTADQVAGMDKDEVWQLRSGILMEEISAMGPQAMTIKLCDRLSNLREAKYTRTGKRLHRYVGQTEVMLGRIPRKTHSELWDTLKRECDSMAKAEKSK